ncbi:MAG TPA: cellulase N-terminal Ig-like domain-containing protein, partial [Jiangellaceae bacterium]
MTDDWPTRPLLGPDLSNSLDGRNLAKEVYERRVIDDMEEDAGWTASDVVTLEYTTESARSASQSLRFSTELRNEDYIRAARRENGSFTAAGVLFPQMPFAAVMSRQFSPAQDWSGYNRLSLWCFAHPTADSVMQTNQLCLGFVCDGAEAGPVDPIAVHYVGDLTPGEWNRIVWEIPEIRRDRVSNLQIFQPTAGVGMRGAPRRITYDFDELCVERVDAEPVDGWAVTTGKIAYCHIGYQGIAEKIAIAPDGPESFSLIDAETRTPVTTLPVKRIANRRGNYRLLDFSTFDQPGEYRLQYDKRVTEPFVIANDPWRQVVEATLNAFYGLRCGHAVAGVHDAC